MSKFRLKTRTLDPRNQSRNSGPNSRSQARNRTRTPKVKMQVSPWKSTAIDRGERGKGEWRWNSISKVVFDTLTSQRKPSLVYTHSINSTSNLKITLKRQTLGRKVKLELLSYETQKAKLKLNWLRNQTQNAWVHVHTGMRCTRVWPLFIPVVHVAPVNVIFYMLMVLYCFCFFLVFFSFYHSQLVLPLCNCCLVSVFFLLTFVPFFRLFFLFRFYSWGRSRKWSTWRPWSTTMSWTRRR